MEHFINTAKGEPTYCYAHNENGQPIHIKDVTDEYRKLHKFTCPYCHDAMKARIRGIKRCKHFAHLTEKCTYSNYLHTIAIERIRELFDTNNTAIWLKYKITETCSIYGCPFERANCNVYVTSKSINLREIYDTLETEKDITGKDGNQYRADILLSDSKGTEEPLLIEVFCTHKCSEDKIHSGLRIIEVQIHSEEDIDHLCESQTFEVSQSIKLYNIITEKTVMPKPSWCQIQDISSYTFPQNLSCSYTNASPDYTTGGSGEEHISEECIKNAECELPADIEDFLNLQKKNARNRYY